MARPFPATRALWSEQDGLVWPRRLAPWFAALLLALVAALVVAGLAGRLTPTARAAPGLGGSGDGELYRRTIQDVAHGESYYAAAAKELRRGGFPLRPFMTLRPPLLAVALAKLPGVAARAGALALLATACFAAWAWRLRDLAAAQPWRYGAALLLLLSGIGPAFAPSAYLFHESWAALLIALSLALYRPQLWGVSLALGLAAALVRELAAAYLLAMAVLALLEGRRPQAAAWVAALCMFAAALAVHAAAVAGVTSLADLRSPGWLGLGGWPFVLRVARWNVVLLAAPTGLAALAVPPALLGLACRPGDLGRRVAAVVLGYAGAFCIVGRPDNAYWGLMIAPLWPLGLLAADAAMATLWVRLRTRSASAVGGARYA